MGSDLSKIEHNFEDLLSGRTDFSTMLANDGAVLEHRIALAPAAVQPFLQIAYSGFKAGASSVVALGQNALGGLVAENTDTQATMLLNIMQAAGIPTNGILSIAEHAALVDIINGLKAALDRMHIIYATPPLPPTALAPPSPPSVLTVASSGGGVAPVPPPPPPPAD